MVLLGTSNQDELLKALTQHVYLIWTRKAAIDGLENLIF